MIEPFPLEKHWKRVYGLDHGYTNPTCLLACAVDEYGNHFIYFEHYQREWEISRHAKLIRKHAKTHKTLRNEAGMPIVRCADPSMWGQGKGITARSFKDEYRKEGVILLKANNAVEAGILHMKELLKVDPNHEHPITGEMGAPRLYIFNTCKNLITELPGYEWEEQKDGRNSSEKPKKINDHALDALRYIGMHYIRESYKKRTKKKLDKHEQYRKIIYEKILEQERAEKEEKVGFERYGE